MQIFSPMNRIDPWLMMTGFVPEDLSQNLQHSSVWLIWWLKMFPELCCQTFRRFYDASRRPTAELRRFLSMLGPEKAWRLWLSAYKSIRCREIDRFQTAASRPEKSTLIFSHQSPARTLKYQSRKRWSFRLNFEYRTMLSPGWEHSWSTTSYTEQPAFLLKCSIAH